MNFKKGDHVVYENGPNKNVYKIKLKPSKRFGVPSITIDMDGYRRTCYAQWFRLATNDEIENMVRS